MDEPLERWAPRGGPAGSRGGGWSKPPVSLLTRGDLKSRDGRFPSPRIAGRRSAASSAERPRRTTGVATLALNTAPREDLMRHVRGGERSRSTDQELMSAATW